MRVANLLLTSLAVAPSLTLAAPINPAHYEELEARWNPFHLSAGQQERIKDFGLKAAHDVGTVVKAAAPVALSLAPLVLKREEEEMGLFKRTIPAHYEDLEARWNPLGLSDDQKKKIVRVGREVAHDAGKVAETVGPIALRLAPLVLKREEEETGLLKRRSPAHYEDLEARWNPLGLSANQQQSIKDFGRKAAHGAEEAWNVLGPTAVNLAAQHYHLLPRDVDEALVARALEFAGAEEELHKRDAMPELLERDFSPIEELERRGRFWDTVEHGAKHVFEQLGPTALEVAANLAKSRGHRTPLA